MVYCSIFSILPGKTIKVRRLDENWLFDPLPIVCWKNQQSNKSLRKLQSFMFCDPTITKNEQLIM